MACQNDCSRFRVELLPLPLARGVAEVVRPAMGMDGISDLLPLDFSQSLLVAQSVVMVRVNAVEILRNELG